MENGWMQNKLIFQVNPMRIRWIEMENGKRHGLVN